MKHSHFLMEKDKVAQIAELVVQQLINFNILLFYGEMGAGKTTLIQKICFLLGCAETVQSPTFSIINEYYSTVLNRKIIHADLFRLNSIEELIQLGWEDYLYDPKNIILIEWPQITVPLLPQKKLVLILEHLSENKRQVQFIENN